MCNRDIRGIRMKYIKSYADGGEISYGGDKRKRKPKTDKSCEGPKAWGGGQSDNSPGQSRSGQQAGALSSKPQLSRDRMYKPEKPGILERMAQNKAEKQRQEELKKRNLRPANPRFL